MSPRTNSRRAGILALIVLVAVAGALSGCGKKKLFRPMGFYDEFPTPLDNGTFSVEISKISALNDKFLLEVVIRNDTTDSAVFDPADIECFDPGTGLTYFSSTKDKQLVSTYFSDLLLPMELDGGKATAGKIELLTGNRVAADNMFPETLVFTYGESRVEIP